MLGRFSVDILHLIAFVHLLNLIIAEGLERKSLDALLKGRYPQCVMTSYPDVIHLELTPEGPRAADVFFFDVSDATAACLLLEIGGWGLVQAYKTQQDAARFEHLQP